MNCPACHVSVPTPSDPTLRFAKCPGCGASVDLAAVPEGGTEVKTVPRMAPPVDPLIGKDFAGGRYRIEALLGIGGMGRVYRATQRGLGRAVALKVLSPEFAKDEQFRRRFDREAGTLASLEHPNIVTVHDVGTEGDTPYIVMSLVTGRNGEPTSLRNVLDAGPIDEEWALRIVQQTCAALEYAHGRGVVHRDIKPGNILIDGEGRAKIADFGIARVGAGGDRSQLTSTGAMLGTMRYMAPEQMTDAAHADARSDLYSLGVVLYEMLTGETPVGRFEMPSEAKRGLDRRLDAIVDRALRRAAAQRYQSAAEMARDLSRITTEREYGRLTGVVAGAAPTGGSAGGNAGGTAGGLSVGTVAGAPATGGAGASAAVESRGTSDVARAGTSGGGGAAPVAATFASPGAAAVPGGRRRPAWVAPAAIGGAVVGIVVAIFAFRGGDSPKPAPSPTPLATNPSPPTPPVPPGGPAMGTPPPPPVKPPPTSDDPPAAPEPDPDPATGGPPAEADLSEDDRADLEDARKSILALLSYGSRISAEDFDTDDTSLPAVKGTDLPGAVAAVRTSLELLRDGKDVAVADRIPVALLPSLGKPLGVPAVAVRAKLASDYYPANRVASFTMGKAAAVGADWALVRYDAAAADGQAATLVAVCVREGGVWKVFL